MIIDDLENILDTSDIEELIYKDKIQKKQKESRKEETNWNENIREIKVENFLGKLKSKITNLNFFEDYVETFFTDSLLTFFRKQINKRIKKTNESILIKNLNSTSSGHEFRNDTSLTDFELTTIIEYTINSEIKKFFAILIYMGICKLPEINMYWRKKSIFCCDFIKQIMSYNRFTELNMHISLANMKTSNSNEKRNTKENTEKICLYLNNLFNSVYEPRMCLSIDEKMCKFKCRYSFKTYMPLKPTKVGMKFYICADSKTSFVGSFIFYTGSNGSIKETVQKLLTNFESKNHRLLMDNFYNSFDLSKILIEKKIYTFGTLRNSRGGPSEIELILKKSKKGDFKIFQKEKTNFLYWHDKKPVLFISIFHDFGNILEIKNEKLNLKPEMIKDYNLNMGGLINLTKCFKFIIMNVKINDGQINLPYI